MTTVAEVSSANGVFDHLGIETNRTPPVCIVSTTALEASSVADDFAPGFTDFPQRLKRFKEESGLSWAEIARRLGADPKTVRRWHKDGVLPNAYYLLALQDLAEGYGLGHLFTVRAMPYQAAESEGRGESKQDPGVCTTGGEQNAGSAHTTASVKRP